MLRLRVPAQIHPSDGVFVGSFRGRVGPKQAAAAAAATVAAADGACPAPEEGCEVAEAHASPEEQEQEQSAPEDTAVGEAEALAGAVQQPAAPSALPAAAPQAEAHSSRARKKAKQAQAAPAVTDGAPSAQASPHPGDHQPSGDAMHVDAPSPVPPAAKPAVSKPASKAAVKRGAKAAPAAQPAGEAPMGGEETCIRDGDEVGAAPEFAPLQSCGGVREADGSTAAAAAPKPRKPRAPRAQKPDAVAQQSQQPAPTATGDVPAAAAAAAAAAPPPSPGAAAMPAAAAAAAASPLASPLASPRPRTVREPDYEQIPEPPRCLSREVLEALVADWCGRNVSKSKLHKKKLGGMLPEGVLGAAAAAVTAGAPVPTRPEGTPVAVRPLPMRTRVVLHKAAAAAAAAPGAEAEAEEGAAGCEEAPTQGGVAAAATSAPAPAAKKPAAPRKRKAEGDPAGAAAVPEAEPALAPAPAAEPTPSLLPAAIPADADGAAFEPKKKGGAVAGARKPNRGRVKKGSVKSGELVNIGTLVLSKGWHNGGYIFPDGFTSRMVFRSSVALDQLCVHECTITAAGKCAPAPTFKITASDRPDEPLEGKSATMCWNLVLGRINGEIERRRAGGEDLPPPPKTAIAGPEYFGLNQAEAVAGIEALDPEHKCVEYWEGKGLRAEMAADPEAAAARAPGAAKPRRAPAAGCGAAKKRRRRGEDSDEGETADGEEVDEEALFASRKWSAINRGERYRARAGDTSGPCDDTNPCSELIDPITLEPVVNPAISPFGHVMGLATWSACLAESGVCPFTKQPLRTRDLVVLTHLNFERYQVCGRAV